jgi:hypothetical protein
MRCLLWPPSYSAPSNTWDFIAYINQYRYKSADALALDNSIVV